MIFLTFPKLNILTTINYLLKNNKNYEIIVLQMIHYNRKYITYMHITYVT